MIAELLHFICRRGRKVPVLRIYDQHLKGSSVETKAFLGSCDLAQMVESVT